MSAPPEDRPHNAEPTPTMDPLQIKYVLEACLLVAGRAMTVAQLHALFGEESVGRNEEPAGVHGRPDGVARSGDDDRPADPELPADVPERDDAPASDRPARAVILAALTALQADYADRGIELVEVASGWRLQSRQRMEPWVARLLQERPPRYSRALLETLVLVAYRQPITRGEIEEVRGVAVSSSIIKTLQEREWVREVGHKDVPGRPALLGTTRQFLDYFNLKRLEDLPPLGELKDLDALEPVIDAGTGDLGEAAGGTAANDAGEAGDVDEPDRDACAEALTDSPVETGPGPEQDSETGAGADTHATPRDVTQGSDERTFKDPQLELRRVVDRFAAEHRDDLRAQGRWRDDPVPADLPAPPTDVQAESSAVERDDDVP